MVVKDFIMLAFLLLLPSVANCQISTRSSDVSVVDYRQPYDSLSNFEFDYDVISKEYYSCEDAKKYVMSELSRYENQKIYFVEMPKKKAAQNKEWRISDDLSRLRGKYYTIFKIEPKIEKSYSGTYKLDKIVFKIVDDSGKKTKWVTPPYSCDDAVLVGYYDRLKSESVGKHFIYNGIVTGKRANFINPELTHKALNTRSNKTIPLNFGEEWTCTDIQLVDDDIVIQLYAVFENFKGDEILARIENIFKTKGEQDVTFYSCFVREDKYSDYKANLIKQFGEDSANKILMHTVSLGMTEEMCKEAWGNPIEINSTHLDGKTLIQWVYNNSFLYFDNGILTSVQN